MTGMMGVARCAKMGVRVGMGFSGGSEERWGGKERRCGGMWLFCRRVRRVVVKCELVFRRCEESCVEGQVKMCD